MFTPLRRVIKSGLDSFSRDGGLAAANIFIMVMTISVITSIFLFQDVSQFLVSSIQEKVDEITKAKDEVQTELDRRDEEIKQATLVSRKEALGDAAEGIEDADILDEVKYEMALLKKENAALKAAAENPLTEEEKAAAAVLKAAEKKDGTEDASLEKGSRQKDAEDDLKACGDRVLKRAYGDGTEGE